MSDTNHQWESLWTGARTRAGGGVGREGWGGGPSGPLRPGDGFPPEGAFREPGPSPHPRGSGTGRGTMFRFRGEAPRSGASRSGCGRGAGAGPFSSQTGTSDQPGRRSGFRRGPATRCPKITPKKSKKGAPAPSCSLVHKFRGILGLKKRGFRVYRQHMGTLRQHMGTIGIIDWQHDLGYGVAIKQGPST